MGTLNRHNVTWSKYSPSSSTHWSCRLWHQWRGWGWRMIRKRWRWRSRSSCRGSLHTEVVGQPNKCKDDYKYNQILYKYCLFSFISLSVLQLMVMAVSFHRLEVIMVVLMLKRIVLIIKMRATVKMCVGTSRASTASAIISIQPSKVATLKHKDMLTQSN